MTRDEIMRQVKVIDIMLPGFVQAAVRAGILDLEKPPTAKETAAEIFRGWVTADELPVLFKELKSAGLEIVHRKSRQPESTGKEPGKDADAGPKVENAQAFQEGAPGGQINHRQVGTPRDALSVTNGDRQ